MCEQINAYFKSKKIVCLELLVELGETSQLKYTKLAIRVIFQIPTSLKISISKACEQNKYVMRFLVLGSTVYQPDSLTHILLYFILILFTPISFNPNNTLHLKSYLSIMLNVKCTNYVRV